MTPQDRKLQIRGWRHAVEALRELDGGFPLCHEAVEYKGKWLKGDKMGLNKLDSVRILADMASVGAFTEFLQSRGRQRLPAWTVMWGATCTGPTSFCRKVGDKYHAPPRRWNTHSLACHAAEGVRKLRKEIEANT